MPSNPYATVTIQIPRETHHKLTKLPWGSRQRIMAMLLERVAEAVEHGGDTMIGALYSGEFHFAAGSEPPDASQDRTALEKYQSDD